MNNPPKILFKYPSRNRPQRFFQSLDSLYNNLDDPDNFLISCTLDEDDLTMANDIVVERIKQYKNTQIEWGLSKSKVDAVNRSMPNYDWDICIVHSDDMVFNIYGFDTMIRVDAMTHFIDSDFLLHYPDQDAKEYLATMYIGGRKFYERFGYIYHPSYKSLWCDNEIMTIAQMLGKYKYLGYQINVHLNAAYGHMERDALFDEQQGHWNDDEINFYERKARNFDLHEVVNINKFKAK